MKNISLFIFLLLSASLFAQTWYNPGGNQGQHISGIGFYNDSSGYAAGSNDILQTTDYGHNWYSQASGGSNFTTVTTTYGIYAGNYNGSILYPGFSSWYTVNGVNIGDVQDIKNTAAYQTYAITPYGRLYSTLQGNFTVLATISGVTNAMFFTSPSQGFIAGSAIWQTLDSGKTWAVKATPLYTLRDVFFPTAYTGYAVGGNQLVMKTTNGGITWDSITYSTANITYNSVWFTDSLTGYVASDSGGYFTLDGGHIWKPTVGIDKSYNCTDVYFVDPCHGYMSTYGDNIYGGQVFATKVQTYLSGATPLTNCDSVIVRADTAGCVGCTYAWSNGANTNHATFTQTGTYTVTMTNACGTATASIPVSVLHKPTAQITYTRSINNYYFSSNAQNATGYKWTFSTGRVDSTAYVVDSFLTAGRVIVSLKVTNTCGSNTYYDTLNIVPLCNDRLSQNQVYADTDGIAQTIQITNIGCPWHIDASGCPWLVVTPTMGNGTDSFHIVVSPNTDTIYRQCDIIVDSLYIFVYQDGRTPIYTNSDCNTPVDTSVQVNGCSMAAATIAGASYYWFLNGTVLPNANSQYYTATQNGYYHVSINVGNCTYHSNDHYLSVCEAIDEPAVSNLSIYPNPNVGTFTITGDVDAGAGGNIRIYNMLGQLVYEKNAESTTGHLNIEVSINNMAEGIYQFIFTSGEKVSTAKLSVVGLLK